MTLIEYMEKISDFKIGNSMWNSTECLASTHELEVVRNEAEKVIEHLLLMKKQVKKIKNSLPDDCNLLRFYLCFAIGRYHPCDHDVISGSKMIDHKCRIEVRLEFTKTIETVEEYAGKRKKFKALKKLIEHFKIKENGTCEAKYTYEDFIYVINRTIEYLKESIKDINKNLDVLNKPIS